MYKLISTSPYEMTRDVTLQNLSTETIDVCFDDSDLFSTDNFDFMKMESEYDCKIWLFGDFNEDGEEFHYIKKIQIGKKEFIEVSDENHNIYYISNYPENMISKDYTIRYRYSRKDLLQVGEMIYPRIRTDFVYE